MPPGGRLPDLNGKQTRALLNHFARHWQHAPGGGSAIAGQARDGRPFSFHADHPGGGIRRDFLPRVPKMMGVTRDEFWDWLDENR